MLKTKKKELKVQWDYTRTEIKQFIQGIIDRFEAEKIANNDPEQQDSKYFHTHSMEVPFSLHDGFYTHNLVMYQYKHGKKILYGLYIKAVQKNGNGPGKDWTSLQPVVKFYELEKFVNDDVLTDMYNHFQRNKEFKKSLDK